MRPIKTILVGVDFTSCSGAALREAIRLARLHSGRVHVVHVVDTQIAIEMESVLTQMQSDICAGLAADARHAWQEFVRGIPEAAGLNLGVTVEHRTQGILRQAHETGSDLLVLGAFGDRRPDVGSGTVATSCVRHSSCDVLLVRESHRGAYSRIVAAVDFSETSLRALERAAQIARGDHAELYVVHLFTAPWDRYHYRELMPQADPKFSERFKSLLSQRLLDFAKPVKEAFADVTMTSELSDAGPHRSGIAEYAERVGADLICLGTRGRSNVRDMLLGSTAEKALLQSKCTILAVRPDANVRPHSAGSS